MHNVPEITPNLGLYLKNPVTDGNDTFNIETMLNRNWRKIDEKVALKTEVETSESVQQKIDEAIAGLINGAPEALDTLRELAQAMGDDPNFATTVLNRLTTAEQNFAAHSADYVKHPGYAVATGVANAYEIILNPAPSGYTDGMAVTVKINVDSTGSSTLNVNGLGAKPLKKANGNDVTNLKANGVYTFRYNASTGNFILQGEGGEFSEPWFTGEFHDQWFDTGITVPANSVLLQVNPNDNALYFVTIDTIYKYDILTATLTTMASNTMNTSPEPSWDATDLNGKDP